MPAQDKVFNKIVSELSEEFDMPKAKIDFIVRSYYKEAKEIIESGDLDDLSTLKAIHFPGFGKMILKSADRLEYMRKKRADPNNNAKKRKKNV